MRWLWFCFSTVNSVRACYGRHVGYQFNSSQATPLRDYTPKQQQKTVVELAVSPLNVLQGTRTVKDDRGRDETDRTDIPLIYPICVVPLVCSWACLRRAFCPDSTTFYSLWPGWLSVHPASFPGL